MISWPQTLLIIWFSLITGHAEASNHCEITQKLRQYAENRFVDIKGNSYIHKFTSTYVLDNAKTCLIDENQYFSEFSCEWYISKGRGAVGPAQAAYGALLSSLIACVAEPDSLEREPLIDRLGNQIGEDASLMDAYSAGPPARERRVLVGYDYYSHWWIVTLRYVIYTEN